MSTIHTEASVAASEVEPSASNIYDYSESINDNDEKLDEGLRAPIPIHDDYLADTSLLSDNELEAFVKTKHYRGKESYIPSNLNSIFQRLSGYNKWTSSIYEKSQPKPVKIKQNGTPTNAFTQNEEAFINNIISENNAMSSPISIHPEPSPFPSITPAQSQANMPLDSMDGDLDKKPAIPYPVSLLPQSPSIPSYHGKDKDYKEEKEREEKVPVTDCTMKELMNMVSTLTSEVIHLQQNVYIKDIQIKNMYLRLREFDHISFPQIMIERVHIVANYNNKHKFSHKSKYKQKRTTLSNEDSVSHGGTAMIYNPKYTGMAHIKHHSAVSLEVITRWIPRYNIPNAVKKGLVYIKDNDLDDIDDYLSHQMWNDWNDRCKKYSINGLDKMKREDVHKHLVNYMQHERVGLVRVEILRGKKYKKYKRIEKKFESLIIPIPDIPKGDTYHIMIKVHNPSASIWGPLSNMISIKVPLKFIEDDADDDTYTKDRDKKSQHRVSNGDSSKGNKTKK